MERGTGKGEGEERWMKTEIVHNPSMLGKAMFHINGNVVSELNAVVRSLAIGIECQFVKPAPN